MQRPKYLRPAPTLRRSSRAAAILVAACIALYQKHLSPLKGFSCAHRVRHGGLSCSEFVRRAALHNGVRGAMPLARERFRECSQAARQMRALRLQLASSGALQDGDEDSRRRWTDACDVCDVADCALSGLDCGILDCGACGCSL